MRKTIKQLTDELNSGKIERGSKEWNTLTGAIREAKEALRNVNNELSAVDKTQGGGFLKNIGVEWAREGKVPLHTLRANIDYGFAEANTTAGKIGIKVWICKKEGFQARAPRSEGRRGDRRERGDRKEAR